MSGAALLSRAECEEVIRKLLNNDADDAVEVLNYHTSQFAEGYPGFLGDYHRLTVEYRCGDNEAKQTSFFVKSLPISNEKKRDMLTDSGIFAKEVNIFREIIPKLAKYSDRKWTPSCYYARDDLLVLENLELTSFRILPQSLDPNITHVKMALRSLAAFHGASIVYERLELHPRQATIGSEYASMLFETSYTPDSPWCMTGIRALKTVALHATKYGIGSRYEHVIADEFMARAQWIFEILACDVPGIPKVLCHRDLWRNNLMYRYEGDDVQAPPLDCQLIDFQIARYCPLPLDVIICVLLPSAESVEMSDVPECLRFYYDQLTVELKRHDVAIESVMPFGDFEAACEHFKLMPLLQQAMFFSLCHLPTSYILDLLENNEEEYMRISLHARDDVVLEFMKKDEFYRRTMTRSVERLIEYLFDICAQ